MRWTMLHCDGCGETRKDNVQLVGKKCAETYGPAEAVVREATPQETQAYEAQR